MAEGDKTLDELRRREEMIEFLQSEQFDLVLSKSTKKTVEHILVRMGIRIEGAQGINDVQADMQFLRDLRKEHWIGFEKRMESLERELVQVKVDQLTHQKLCGEQNRQMLARFDKADDDRATIKRDIRLAVIAFIGACVSIIGWFSVNYVFVSVQP